MQRVSRDTTCLNADCLGKGWTPSSGVCYGLRVGRGMDSDLWNAVRKRDAPGKRAMMGDLNFPWTDEKTKPASNQ